jgi:hypothetical protein
MDIEQLRARIAELNTQIEALRTERTGLRLELAEATTPFKVGDVIESTGRYSKQGRWRVEAIEPGRFLDDDFNLVLRIVRVNGTLGERTSQYYAHLQFVKVGEMP